MEFGILGPLEVAADGRRVAVHPAKQRTLLGVLLLHANEVVSSERLAEELWGADAPASAAKLVHVHISRLRKALGGDGAVIRTRAPGYVLEVAAGSLDAARFEQLVAEARALADAGEREAAVAAYDGALGLWRGRVLADVAFESSAARERESLEELRLAARVERAECELALGRHERVIAELEALVTEHPLRERPRAQLMLALYRCGRQGDALAAYQDARRMLVGELGLDPGPELQRLEAAILRQDPELELPRRRTPARRPDARRRKAPVVAAGVVVVAAVAVIAALASAGREPAPRLLEPRSLGRIDPRTNRIVDAIAVGSRPAFVAAGRRAVWIAGREGLLSRIDPHRRRVAATVPVRAQVSGLAVNRHGVWLADDRSHSVVHVDPHHAAVAWRLRLRRPWPRLRLGGPLGPAITAGHGAVWIASGQTTLSRLDVRRRRAVAVATPATGVNDAIAHGEGTVWAGGRSAVARVSPATGNVTSVIRLPAVPSALATGERAAWATLERMPGIVRIDARTEAVETIAIGAPATALAVGFGAVWVAVAARGEVLRVDPARNAVIARIATGAAPRALAVSADGVWVAVT